MKNMLSALALVCLLAGPAWTQLQNKGASFNITAGSTVTALNGIINTDGGALTVDGTLTTPTGLANTAGAALQGNGQYFIGGDWNNDATFNAGTSTVTFNGDQSSTVGSGGEAFYDLALHKTANDLILADGMDVANTLDFQSGDNYIILGDHNLQVLDITGYDATRHVRSTGTGFLIRTVGAVPVVFPVGNSAYNPATLANAGSSDQYFLRVTDAVLSDGDSGNPLTADAVERSWFIEESTPDGSDLTLTVQWNGSEELSGFDHSASYVSHYTGGSWDTQPVVSAAGAGPYTLTRAGIASLSPFAVFGSGFMPVIDISGIILWENDAVSGVKDVNVALKGDDTDNDLTPLDGTYSLTASNGSDFTVNPAKNINKLNGVTVADAVAIQQHVAGNIPITSPYKQVAADVNKSNSITGFDATIINQSILGNPAALNQFKTSWRFVPISYTLSIPPWGFPENIALTGVSGSVPGQDFWGVKTGDVVDTYANPANLVPNPPLVLRVEDRVLKAGEVLTATFRAGHFDDLAGWQLALGFDPGVLQLTSSESLSGDMPVIFGTNSVPEGVIRSLWSQAEGMGLEASKPVFRLNFEVMQGGALLSDVLQIDEAAIPALAYTSNLEESGVELVFDQTSSVNHADNSGPGLEVWPNPFVERVTISIELPEACTAQLRVLDAGGREIYLAERNFPAGAHQEVLSLNGQPAGMLFCELITPFGVLTKKMTKIGY